MKLHESPVAAIHAATAEMEGAYGFCMLLEGEPDTVYGIRRGSPLIAAKDETGSYVASDVPAIIEYTRQYYLLEEEEVVVAHYGELRFYAPDGTPTKRSQDRQLVGGAGPKGRLSLLYAEGDSRAAPCPGRYH